METDKIRKAWNEAHKTLVAGVSDTLTLEEICCIFFELGWNVGVERNSTIQWQTGEPKKNGSYIVTLKNGDVDFDYWRISPNWSHWSHEKDENIVAWCKLSDIKPYKEEEL